MGLRDMIRTPHPTKAKNGRTGLPHRHCSSCEKYRTFTNRSEALNLPLSDIRKLKEQSGNITDKCQCASVDEWVHEVNRSQDIARFVDSALYHENMGSFTKQFEDIELNGKIKRADSVESIDSSTKSELRDWIAWRKQANDQLLTLILYKQSGSGMQMGPWEYAKRVMSSNSMNEAIQYARVSGSSHSELDGKPFIMYGIPRARIGRVHAK